MCLINQTFKQYQGNIRWKFLKTELLYNKTTLRSPSFMFYWNMKDNIAADSEFSRKNQWGLHVYLSQRTALNAAKTWFREYSDFKQTTFIVKLKCSNFLGGGVIHGCDEYSDNKRGERWGKADILAVYDIDGREVTKMFFKD